MNELIEKISNLNSAELQRFCDIDADKDEPDALRLEAHLLELIYRRLDSETFGVEDEESEAERLLRLCVETMDIPTTVEMILTLSDETGD